MRPGSAFAGNPPPRPTRIRGSPIRPPFSGVVAGPAKAGDASHTIPVARVAKLVDAPGLGPDAFTGVPVRVRPRAPKHNSACRETHHGRQRRNAREAGTPHHPQRRCGRHQQGGRVAPAQAVAHGQGRRLPSRQGADVGGGPALRLLGAVRGGQRPGRRGLRPGGRRGQAARGRCAAHQPEGRCACRHAGLRGHLRGLSRSQDR